MTAPSIPKRLLMTVDAVGGVWRYAMDLGAALAERGVEVTFACFGPAAAQEQVTEAQAIGRFVAVDAPLDWTAASAEALREVPHRLATLVRQTGADLLHLNLPSQAAGLRVDVPVVAVSHSCVVTWFAAVRGAPVPDDWAWQRALNLEGLNRADVVVAPSRSHASLVETTYDSVGKVEVVYNATRPLQNSGQRSNWILAAGRWWDDGKNGRLLDKAAEGSRWPIRMAGSQHGPSGQFLPIEHADYLGALPNAELRRLIASAGIFASPSVYEPFGLAPLEAASAGTPLMLSDIPTYRELWDGAALFAPADDAQAFRAGLDRLAADPELRRALGEAARERAARFTLAAQAEAMLRVYAGAMAGSTHLHTLAS